MTQAWESVDVESVDVHVDSDWARGPERTSTSGCMMMMCGTVVTLLSRTQATLVLSTAEAEYFAVITGAAEALGMQSMLLNLGLSAQVFESGQTPTLRLGITRHVELRYLRLQDAKQHSTFSVSSLVSELSQGRLQCMFLC